MSQLTRWVLAHKLLIVLFWSIVTVAGFAFVSSATGALSQNTSIGSESEKTDLAISRIYSNGNHYPVIAVLTLPRGTTIDTPGVRAQLGTALARV
jgi:RND superfamily putative drug exporter